MKTKVELLEEIVKKQDEYIKIADKILGEWETSYAPLTELRRELYALKSQLAEAGEEKKDYSHLCCICHENYVDSDNGYDTCDSCMNRV